MWLLQCICGSRGHCRRGVHPEERHLQVRQMSSLSFNVVLLPSIPPQRLLADAAPSTMQLWRGAAGDRDGRHAGDAGPDHTAGGAGRLPRGAEGNDNRQKLP